MKNSTIARTACLLRIVWPVGAAEAFDPARRFIRERLFGVVCCLLACTAPVLAATVTVDFVGSLEDSTIPGLPVGTNFFGSFQYRTDAPIVVSYDQYRQFALAGGELSLTIGGHTFANDNSDPSFPDVVQVTDDGRLGIYGNGMAGTGPLVLNGAFAQFAGTSDPAFATLQLPVPFPMDFTSSYLVLSGEDIFTESASGTFIVKETSVTDIPEPSTGLLAAAGFAIAGLSREHHHRPSKPIPQNVL